MKDYTLKELVRLFWKSLIWVICLALIGGVIFGYVAKRKQTTVYTASRKVLITHNLNEVAKTASPSGDPTTDIDQAMMPTYAEIVENREVTDTAWKNLSKPLKKQITKNKLNNAVKAKTDQGSLVLNVEASESSPSRAIAIVNATADAFKNELPRLQPGAGQVVTLARANSNDVSSKTTPHAKKYAAVGVALGGLAGIIISLAMITIKDVSKRAKKN